MRIIKPSTVIETGLNSSMLQRIERFGRTCYKSIEKEITDETAAKFTAMIIEKGHHSVLEHVSMSVRFIVDRGVSHEIVRHRLASYSQESTRYCNYSKDRFGKEITVIKPCILQEGSETYKAWHDAMVQAEKSYFYLIDAKYSPQWARSVLPNSLKTEIVMTANAREWRHFFTLRTAPAAHPQMREVACPLLRECRECVPVLFDDVGQVDE